MATAPSGKPFVSYLRVPDIKNEDPFTNPQMQFATRNGKLKFREIRSLDIKNIIRTNNISSLEGFAENPMGTILKGGLRYGMNKIAPGTTKALDKFDDMIKVYAMTSHLDMMNKRPDDYVEMQSGTKRALVELNAYGVNKQSKVRKVIARADASDLNKVKERLKTYTERTTVCENLIDMVRRYSGRMAYEE